MTGQLTAALGRSEADEVQNQALAFLTIRQVCERVGHRKSWVWAAVKSGFPAPIHIGTSARWISSEIDAWQRAQIERSRKAA